MSSRRRRGTSRALNKNDRSQSIDNSSFFMYLGLILLISFFLGVLYTTLILLDPESNSISSTPFLSNRNSLKMRLHQLEQEIKSTVIKVEQFARRKMSNTTVQSKDFENLVTQRKGLIDIIWGSGTKNSLQTRNTNKKYVREKVCEKHDVILSQGEYIPPKKNARYDLCSTNDIHRIAKRAIAVKGKYIDYLNSYGNIRTRGSYYQYNQSAYRSINGHYDPCEISNISLKYSSECEHLPLSDDYKRQILVTAVQRSGTHYIWEMLNRLGVDVHHEGVGPDGAISWLFAYKLDMFGTSPKYSHLNLNAGNSLARDPVRDSDVPLRTKPPPNRYVINNEEHLTYHRFQHVFHQVRHPLRVISTLIRRCGKWDRIWLWLSLMDGCEYINKYQTPLKRSMLLWVIWNKHIEKYADIRFQSENTSPRDVCTWAKFPKEKCGLNDNSLGVVIEPVHSVISGDRSKILSAEEKSRLEKETSGELPEVEAIQGGEEEVNRDNEKREDELRGRRDHRRHSNIDELVTWEMLERTDKALADEIKIMCVEYGYTLDPSQHTQPIRTKEFTA